MATTPLGDPVSEVRSFNRFWTAKIGALRSGLLDTQYSLAQARVIFEIANRPGIDLTTIREMLGVDGGYLSRVLNGLKDDGVVVSERSAEDARRKLLRLTPKGQQAFEDLDARSRHQIGALLDELPDEHRERAVAAMRLLEDLFSEQPQDRTIAIRPVGSGDLGWMVYRHGLLGSEHGFDERFEGSVAQTVADFALGRDLRREAGWVAESEGVRSGSALCTRADDGTARLELLVVAEEARRRDTGLRLVERCLHFARRAGYRRVTASTGPAGDYGDILEPSGFVRTLTQTHHLFGPVVDIGQWELTLTDDTSCG